jgi:murein DD-endopeptidase MepM/ murein hydrolase activator NlpD
MQMKKISILLLAAMALSISTTVASTTFKVYANSKAPAAIEQIDNEALLLDAQQMAEAFQIQINQPRLVEYVAKASDSVQAIADTYGVKVTTITVSNGMNKDTTLTEGQKLIFPSIDGIAYKIKDGENLWDISVLYKIDFYDLLDINSLISPDKLKLGQQIILPSVEALKTESPSKPKSTASASTSTAKTTSKTTSSAPLSRGSWPASGSVTSKFGQRWGKAHKGIDIGVPTGTNVKAFKSGKVTYSGWQGSYGYLVIISHGDGLQTYYAHNSKLLVKEGQSVDSGSVIAKSGNTGNSTGPHIHFEVRKNGNPVNPYQYLR